MLLQSGSPKPGKWTRRDDLRQNVALTAQNDGPIDLGTAIREIKAKLDKEIPARERKGFIIEFGGLYLQKQRRSSKIFSSSW